jgi:predicted ATPase
MVGRSDDVMMLSTYLTFARFVTISGIGGVGKTTVAIAVGHELIEAFAGSMLFVDFGALTDPKLVAPALAAMLGLSVRSDHAFPGIVA